ncbi:gamma-glutamyltransferase [Salinibacterium sp. SYSU T00001]|uniref:gamma-glutamyltransferase n=1 Tax=Homoserinimonas sedimenticola TaxID=2986805 RepID=UPI0022362BAA|nr:gamma-glutamyltransferase [Salinibacterium sedimenticola]MCW4385074.1 gamma-glutamyltransferase [Salinibacterium sedimenticola]
MTPRRIAIAAPHTAAIESAEAAVAAGGNAIDAALAAAAALTVVYPHQCALGGDLIALLRRPSGEVTAVISAGAAPAAIDPARFAGLDRMPPQGPDTVTVPGVVAGWQALERLGASLPLSHGLTRAAELAESGYAVSPGLDRALQGRRDILLADEGMVGVFGDGAGGLKREGDAVTQPALAATLRRLAEDPEAMYRGEIAESISARLVALGGAMAASDFAEHRAEVIDPVELEHGGARWWVAPPPTQGVVLLGILPEALSADDPSDPALVEAARAALLTRTAQLGDPRGGAIDVPAMLDPRGRSAEGHLPRPGRAMGDTVAVVAADSDGTVVTLIQSVYQWFGSGILDPATGVVLHNRGSAFSTDPEHPAHVGPGLRPPHTLLPVIAESEDLLVGLGCQGGSAQPWILAQVASGVLDPARDPAEVLSRGRWVIGARDLGFESLTLLAEPGTDAAADAAEGLGLGTARRDSRFDEAGHVQVARLHRHTPRLLDAASDPRADGRAAVFTAQQ